MDISPPHAPWEKGPRFHPVEWTQSKIDWGHKGLLAPTNEQLQQMMKLSKIEGVEYTPLKEGLSHFVFKVFSADHESICIIKAASREQRNSLAGAVYWQGWLEKLIPVPQILFHDLTFDEIPYAFIVFEYMDAQDLITCVDDLSDSELDEIAVKVVEANHALLSIPSCGGFGGAKSHFDKGMFATWGEFLQSIIESTQPQLMVFPKYRLVAEQILQKLDFLKSSIDAVKPLPFLEDATHRNVLISKGRFVGLVDHEEVCFGDPLWAIANTQAETIWGNHNPHYIKALLSNYTAPFNPILYKLYLEILLARKICLSIKNKVDLESIQPNIEIFSP